MFGSLIGLLGWQSSQAEPEPWPDRTRITVEAHCRPALPACSGHFEGINQLESQTRFPWGSRSPNQVIERSGI